MSSYYYLSFRDYYYCEYYCYNGCCCCFGEYSVGCSLLRSPGLILRTGVGDADAGFTLLSWKFLHCGIGAWEYSSRIEYRRSHSCSGLN